MPRCPRAAAVYVVVLAHMLLVCASDTCPMPPKSVSSGDYWNMYFASGKGPRDMGNYDACSQIPNANLCGVYGLVGTTTVLAAAACVPANCSNAELATSASVQEFLRLNFGAAPQFQDALFLPVCTDHSGGKWDGKADAMVAVTVLLVGLVVSATLVGYWRQVRVKFLTTRSPDDAERGRSTIPLLSVEKGGEDASEAQVVPSAPLSLGWELLNAFNAIDGCTELLCSSAARNRDTSSLNGIRVLSMVLVILGHAAFTPFTLGLLNDAAVLPPHGVLSTWTFQVIPSAEFAVDSFFFLSGFLLTLSMLKRLASGSMPRFALLALHRYLRLTPTYAYALFALMYLVPHFAAGPFWSIFMGFIPSCTSRWWTNLLYINNLTPWKQNNERMCFAWSWYLANDMQFFVLSPAVFLLYKRTRTGAVALLLVLLTASVVALVIASSAYKWYSLIDYSQSLGWGDSATYVYVKPWFRAPPYLIGMLTAAVWTNHKTALTQWLHAQTSPWSAVRKYIACYAVALIMTSCAFYGATSFYATLPGAWSTTQLVAYSALSRPAWALGLALLCLLWFCVPADPVARFLSHPCWEVLARLTYGAYIVHPIILAVAVYSITDLPRYSPYKLAFDFVATWGLSYALAAVLFVTIERPFSNIEMVLLKRAGIKVA